MTIVAHLLGRLGGGGDGLTWHDLPDLDPMYVEENIIEIQEECILLAVPEDGIAEVFRPDLSELWETTGITWSVLNPVVAALVGPGEWVVAASSNEGAAYHPVRYAIIPLED